MKGPFQREEVKIVKIFCPKHVPAMQTAKKGSPAGTRYLAGRQPASPGQGKDRAAAGAATI